MGYGDCRRGALPGHAPSQVRRSSNRAGAPVIRPGLKPPQKELDIDTDIDADTDTDIDADIDADIDTGTQLASHQRPRGVDDGTVAAVGKLSEALEKVEEARGHLYAFHRLCGSADLSLGEAVDELRAAGHRAAAELLEGELVGRNILEGRWSYQVVEEYDDTYWSRFRELEARVRDELMAGRRHVFEAEMKEDRRSHGRRHHEAVPDDGGSQSPSR